MLIDTVNVTRNIRILSLGGGVDSTTILDTHLFIEDLGVDAVVFADTGGESKATYEHLLKVEAVCDDHELPFYRVRHDKESLTEFCIRLGVVPLMPGGSHVCSKKFKGDVIAKWAKKQFPGDTITYLIGIEANEGYRSKRFTTPKGDNAVYEYPLIDEGMTREDCESQLSERWGVVPKSSCVFCPFMSEDELIDLTDHDWDLIHQIEDNFKTTSPRKHQLWLDSGKPVDKAGRALKGMWRLDSWAEGHRLFTRSVGGKKLTTREWQSLIKEKVAI
jgi:hypothetical protein